jgi:hypothetical protein
MFLHSQLTTINQPFSWFSQYPSIRQGHPDRFFNIHCGARFGPLKFSWRLDVENKWNQL